MSTLSTTQQPARHSALRLLVARHPVAAFLVVAFAGIIAFELPPVRTLLSDILPFDLRSWLLPWLPPWGPLVSLFGAAIPAFLVMAALHGRAGVRDLARRSLRWRVGARWYLFALLGLPIAVMLCASVIFGLAPLNALVDKWPLLFTVMLPNLLLRIVFFNVIEEIGWTGFLQARLQDRHGPLKACVLIEVPFALWHLPGVLFDTGELPLALVLLGVLAISQLFARVVIMWLYNNTHRSVLLVGLFHSAFNTTNNRFAREFIPGLAVEDAFLIVSGVVVVAAVLMVVFTRGRLSYKPNHVSQIADAPLTKE